MSVVAGRYPSTPDVFFTNCVGFMTDWKSRVIDNCANIMICLIDQCNYLLDLQLMQLTEAFVQNGGLRERMTAARCAERAKHMNRSAE